MTEHVELDLVVDREIAKVFQEYFGLGFLLHPLGVESGLEEGVLHFVRRNVVIDPDDDPHRVQLLRIMQVDDRLADNLIIRDVEVNRVVRPESGRAPIDLHDLGKVFADLEPIAHFVGLIDLQRHAGDDAAEEILGRKGEDDGGGAGGREEAAQLSFRMVAEAQDKEERDQENDECDYFAEKLWDDRLATLFEIKIPEIAIDQRDHHRGTQEDQRGAGMIAPAQIEPVNPGRGVEAEGEGKELEKDAERNASASL